MEPIRKYCYEYPRPAVTTDIVVFGYQDKALSLLLVERKNDPYKGRWSFPGGFMNMDEDAETCARRELREETGLQVTSMEQLHTFSAVDRDPRGRTVSIAYLAIVDRTQVVVRAADDAADAGWFLLSGIPPLAFDHDRILEKALDYLSNRYRQLSGDGCYFELPARARIGSIQSATGAHTENTAGSSFTGK